MARDTAMEHLHPTFRSKAQALMQMFSDERIPFRLFEGFRTPQRQWDLYAQGRTRPGSIVTKAQPWSSYHQYGIAGDFVLFINDAWAGTTPASDGNGGPSCMNLPGALTWNPWGGKNLISNYKMSISLISAQATTPRGDETWADNLEDAIHAWYGTPAAPPVPTFIPTRPPLGGSSETPSRNREGVQKYRVIARRGLRLREGLERHMMSSTVYAVARRWLWSQPVANGTK